MPTKTPTVKTTANASVSIWSRRREAVMVILCLLIFGTLVGLSLMRSSVWHDEGYTAVLIENGYRGIVERTAMDVHPPLYYLLLKTWSFIFGDGVATLRLFSATCMTGAILVIWWLVRRAYGVRTALLALLFMSIGPFMVRYGQEMRMYGLAALLAAVATFVYVLIRETDSPKPAQFSKKRLSLLFAYGAVIAAGMYTQYFFMLIPLAHIVHYLYTTPGTARTRVVRLLNYWPAVALALLLFGAWIPTAVYQFAEVQGGFWIGPVSVETLTSTFQALLLFQKQYELIGSGSLLAVLALVIFAAVAAKFWQVQRSGFSRLMVACVFVPPIILFLLSIPPLQPIYQDRYISFLAGVFYSLLAVGALSFKRQLSRVVAVSAAVLILAIGQWNVYRFGNNHGWQPKPYFTMNEITDQITDDAPVYGTSVWTFFDARTTLRDADTGNQTQLLLAETPRYWQGNYSALFDRPDLVTNTIPQNVRSFWLIDESSKPQYTGAALNAFIPGKSYTTGYATLTRYERQ